MSNNNYKVIISRSSKTSAAVADKLAKLFNISVDQAVKILQQNEFVIKKNTDKKTAEKFYMAIIAAGAKCRIEKEPDEAKLDEKELEEETDLPNIEEQTPPSYIRPLVDPTQADITPLHSEHANLTLGAGRPPVTQTPDNSSEKEFDKINIANFCPECGTIRASADSACAHCGYDPRAIKRRQTRSRLIKSISAIFITSLVLIMALPFYQKFTLRQQISNDLQLAFDTRNSVTEFIQKTNFWPNQNIDANLPKKINNATVKSIIIGNQSVITVTLRKEALADYATDANDQTLIFTPNTLKGHIVWNCLKGTLVKELRPEICRARVIKD